MRNWGTVITCQSAELKNVICQLHYFFHTTSKFLKSTKNTRVVLEGVFESIFPNNKHDQTNLLNLLSVRHIQKSKTVKRETSITVSASRLLNRLLASISHMIIVFTLYNKRDLWIYQTINYTHVSIKMYYVAILRRSFLKGIKLHAPSKGVKYFILHWILHKSFYTCYIDKNSKLVDKIAFCSHYIN